MSLPFGSQIAKPINTRLDPILCNWVSFLELYSWNLPTKVNVSSLRFAHRHCMCFEMRATFCHENGEYMKKYEAWDSKFGLLGMDGVPKSR